MASFSERLAYVLTFDTTSGVKSLQKFGATADKELSKADKQSQKLWATTEKVSAGMLALAGVAGVGLGKMAMGALDTQQNIEALAQVVDDVTLVDLEGWAEEAANALGLSKNAAIENVTSFAQLGKMAGLSGQELSDMSSGLVELGADFAAFKNVSPEKAIQDIRSAFSGSVEVMRKYGIFLDDATLKQAYLRETGIEVTGTLTGQQKVIAVNSELYRQGADMMGQFARESDTLAGQQPILMANLRNLSDEVGSGFLPTMTGAVSVLASFASGVNEANPELLKMVGQMGAAGVAALGLAGSVGMSAAGVKRAATAFGNLSKAMKVATVSAGAIGVVLAVAGGIYASYAAKKAEAAERTREFTAALQNEQDGVAESVEAHLAAAFAAEGFAEAQEALGASTEDLAAFVFGASVPALEAQLEQIGGNTRGANHFANSVDATSKELQTFKRVLGEQKQALRSSTEEMARKAEQAEALEGTVDELAGTVAGYNTSLSASKEWMAAAAAEQKELMEATQEQAEASREAADAVFDQADAQLALADKSAAALLATTKANEVIAGSAEELSDLTEGTYDYLSAVQGQVSDVTAAAVATAALAEEQAEANGETLSASQRTDILNKSLLGAARAADGPLRDALVTTIAQMNGIEEGVVGEIVLLPDTVAAEEALARVSVPRTAQIRAQADVSEADRVLNDWISQQRAIRVQTFVDPGQFPSVGPGGNTLNIPAQEPSRPTGGGGGGGASVPFFYADGTSHHPGGMAVVGEEGPELVNLPGGSQVLPADETVNAFTSAGESAPPLNVTFSGDIYGVPSDEFWDMAADKLKRRLAGRA